MRRVIIQSPYAAGNLEGVKTNVTYARECLQHSLDLGEAPFASHLLYPQVLDEATGRDRGLQAEAEWMQAADLVAFYTDRGWSPGMIRALKITRTILNKPLAVRQFYSRDRVREPLDVKELLTHIAASGLRVYYFGDET